ncbi:hypothetical protein NB640_00120 [Oxalobacter vibrioformis]|uniref:Uncharacterized protein n=1 Tax=Oxalobacter vibrioformis TaxID=933080 RepID=A0A9E9LYX2_9BURK|nr:hypothetical protein [Oxalobacter vibrioformis]WAW10117.1 hypothetical protein NB640_00120 [Oxalobacter vibrioformis]
MKRNVPSFREDASSPPDPGKSTVNAVFEKIMEGQPCCPLPAGIINGDAADLSLLRKVRHQHRRIISASPVMPDQMVRNALEKVRQTSRDSLEKT